MKRNLPYPETLDDFARLLSISLRQMLAGPVLRTLTSFETLEELAPNLTNRGNYID